MKHEYVYDDGGRHQYFQMKYKKDRVGDCVVRALAIATNEDYKSVRDELWDISLHNGNMPNGAPTYEEFLQKRGFIKEKKIKGYDLASYKTILLLHTNLNVSTITSKSIGMSL